MGRVFAYCRVSTTDETAESQVREIEASGYKVMPSHVVSEKIGGGVRAGKRPGFARLLDKLEAGDVLICTKLDRLGRNVIDVCQTIDQLAARGVEVHCLAVGGADLTSAPGKVTMAVLAAVAEFELDLLRERRAAEGKQPGRPARLSSEQRMAVKTRLAQGATVYALAKEFGVARRTIHRIRDAE